MTALYFGLCWIAVTSALALVVVGLWNADLLLSEKGFYGMAFLLALFGAITVQKNVRDSAPLCDDLSFLDTPRDPDETPKGPFSALRT